MVPQGKYEEEKKKKRTRIGERGHIFICQGGARAAAWLIA